MAYNDQYINQIGGVIRSYLPSSEYRLMLFGSRARGTARRWSDVDIGIEGRTRVPLRIMAKIQGALEESDIPYRVDVIDMHTAQKKFREHVHSSSIPLSI